ncbi:MAG: glutathione S-transferase family protein [Sulfitobacter sp.]
MQLFYAKGSVSIVIAITLHEAGLPHELIEVDFKSGAQTKPEYLAINPKGRVPALRLETGQTLTETGAILDYLGAIAPDANLIPTPPLDAAHMRSVMYYLASTMHINHAHKRRGTRWADTQSCLDEMAAKVPQTMTASAAFVEKDCLRGDFVLGDIFSAADPYLFVVCNWLESDGVDIAKFPKINGFLERMRARPSVQTVISKGMI